MPKPKSTSRSRVAQRSPKPRKYGGDASHWVTQVVGDYPHQAQAGNGNVIQQNNPPANNITMTGGFSGSDILNPGNSAYSPISGDPPAYNIPVTTPGAAPMAGGRRKKSSKMKYQKRKGGNVFSEIAVPAVLLVANQTFGKKTGKKSAFYSRKNKSRRFSRRRR